MTSARRRSVAQTFNKLLLENHIQIRCHSWTFCEALHLILLTVTKDFLVKDSSPVKEFSVKDSVPVEEFSVKHSLPANDFDFFVLFSSIISHTSYMYHIFNESFQNGWWINRPNRQDWEVPLPITNNRIQNKHSQLWNIYEVIWIIKVRSFVDPLIWWKIHHTLGDNRSYNIGESKISVWRYQAVIFGWYSNESWFKRKSSRIGHLWGIAEVIFFKIIQPADNLANGTTSDVEEEKRSAESNSKDESLKLGNVNNRIEYWVIRGYKFKLCDFRKRKVVSMVYNEICIIRNNEAFKFPILTNDHLNKIGSSLNRKGALEPSLRMPKRCSSQCVASSGEG